MIAIKETSVARLRPSLSLSLLPPSRGRGMFHSMDGRTAQLSKTLQDHRNLGATKVSIQLSFDCAIASRLEKSFKAHSKVLT